MLPLFMVPVRCVSYFAASTIALLAAYLSSAYPVLLLSSALLAAYAPISLLTIARS